VREPGNQTEDTVLLGEGTPGVGNRQPGDIHTPGVPSHNQAGGVLHNLPGGTLQEQDNPQEQGILQGPDRLEHHTLGGAGRDRLLEEGSHNLPHGSLYLGTRLLGRGLYRLLGHGLYRPPAWGSLLLQLEGFESPPWGSPQELRTRLDNQLRGMEEHMSK
jgi:hypothetical protein